MHKIRTLYIYIIGNIFYLISFLIPKNKNIWIFGSWHGIRYADNSRYLYEYITSRASQVKAIWITKDAKIVKRLSEQGYKCYLSSSFMGIYFSMRAGIAIFSHSKLSDLNTFFINSKTKLVQLWHGVALKKIGYDDLVFSSKTHNKTKKKIRELLFPFTKEKYDLFIATSEETKRIFANAFHVDNSVIKITGYPRNDSLFMMKNHKHVKKYVLYMPTFRGEVGSNFDILKKTSFDVAKYDKILEQNNIILFFKLHPVNNPTDDTLSKINESKNIKFINPEDVYEILGTTDILITDYSSVYFDYLLLDRPIIFFPFDYNEYLIKDRDLNYDYNSVTPGPKANNWDEVINYVIENIKNPNEYSRQRREMLNQFHFYQDNRSCARVYSEILKLINRY